MKKFHNEGLYFVEEYISYIFWTVKSSWQKWVMKEGWKSIKQIGLTLVYSKKEIKLSPLQKNPTFLLSRDLGDNISYSNSEEQKKSPFFTFFIQNYGMNGMSVIFVTNLPMYVKVVRKSSLLFLLQLISSCLFAFTSAEHLYQQNIGYKRWPTFANRIKTKCGRLND